MASKGKTAHKVKKVVRYLMQGVTTKVEFQQNNRNMKRNNKQNYAKKVRNYPEITEEGLTYTAIHSHTNYLLGESKRFDTNNKDGPQKNRK